MSGTTQHKISCRNCGAEFQRNRVDQQFCKRSCGSDFHNRRKERGAIIYDLFMIMRHERKAANTIRAWFTMTRLAMYWWQEDQSRSGQPSWQKAKTVADQTTWAKATVVGKDIAGSRRS